MLRDYQRPEYTHRKGLSAALDVVHNNGIRYAEIASTLALPAVVTLQEQQLQNDLNGIGRLILTTEFECDKDLNDMAMIMAAWLVSQPTTHCTIGLPTREQSTAFISAVRKHMGVFKDNDQYGWELVRCDARKSIDIRTRLYNTQSKLRVEVMKGG